MRQRIIDLYARIGLVCVIAAISIALVGDAYGGDAKKPAVDALGDALPDGALMRMGSMRWRHGDPITFLAYPPNEKTLITATNDATLLIWDRESGKLIKRLAPPADAGGAKGGIIRNNVYTQGLTRAAMTRDGTLLAVVLPGNAIQLWEVETGKAVREIKGPANGAIAMTFVGDGKMLAMRGSDRFLYLYDTQTGNEIRKLKADQPAGKNRVVFGGADGGGIAVSPDGKTIAIPDLELNNQKVVAFITFFETATGKQLRRLELSSTGVSALAFSPDGKWFAHNNSNKVFLREADTGKEVRQFVSNFGANLMVFAPDSQSIAIKSRDQSVRLYNTADGKLLHTVGEPLGAQAINGVFVNYNSTAATDVVFSPDGKTILLGGRQAPRFFDVGTGKEKELPSGGHKGAVSAVIVTPDNKTLLSRGADNVLRIWNTATGAELRQFAEPPGVSSVAFSPDAKFVALALADGTIRLLQTADGKEKRSLKGHPSSTASLAFSADGKMLASRGSYDGILRIYDVEKGAELKQITWQTINAGNGGAVFVRSVNANTGGSPLIFSPDGQMLVTYIAPQQVYLQGQPQQQAGSNCLRFWNVATGKEVRQVELPPNRTINHLAYSPDGRLLYSENTDKTVSVWEAASGRERSYLGKPVVSPLTNNISTGFVVINGIARNGQATSPVGTTIAVSPDGSLLASPGANHTVHVWDAWLAKEIGSFQGHNGDIASLCFAPDGKTLISGSKDTTILVWDLARLKRLPRPQIAELQPKELDALWIDLIASDAGAAGKSIHQLIASPKSSITFLKDQIKPATPVDPAKIDQWILDLDSSNFAKRTIAISQLEKLGELAIPALKKVLVGKAPLETRRRVEPLLEKLTSGSYSAEQIRILRALEVLDKIGTPEARKVLQDLASGAPGALITREAQVALDRQTTARRQP